MMLVGFRARRVCASGRDQGVEEPTEPRHRILLAEDDESLREIFSEYLEEAGYSVVSAATGPEALTKATGWPFDLLITDMTMIGMSGQQLAETLRARLPGLPVLLVSGSVPDAQLRQPDRGFLQKPFSGARLVAKVREMLE